MQRKAKFPNVMFHSSLRLGSTTLARLVTLLFLIFVLVFLMLTAQPAQAQAFKVIYTFTGGADGKSPYAGLTQDAAGNLYGTASEGGFTGGDCYYGCGTVFKLSHKGSGWILNPLYNFQGSSSRDGDGPAGRVFIGPDGGLYGTTTYGGVGDCNWPGRGCGTVFNLRPPATACRSALCSWTETVLYRFTGGADGSNPVGDLVFDQKGNLYGTTWSGGQYGYGTVFQITHSGGGWTEKVIYNFMGGSDGYEPSGGLIFDPAGNLYGTTVAGGNGCQIGSCGTVFQLTPSESGWTEDILHTFVGYDGAAPNGLIWNRTGDLYSTAGAGGNDQGGTAFMLSPAGGSWGFAVLYNFAGRGGGGWGFGGPSATPVMDAAGNLYGPTRYGGIYQSGAIFMLTSSGSGWTYTSLHDFTGGGDGSGPLGSVILDSNGNLYGTTSGGGSCPPYYCGVVFEITP